MSLMNHGNFLEHFAEMGEGYAILHANPAQMTDGVLATYKSLVGQPSALYNGTQFGQDAFGLQNGLVDPFAAFNMVFGKTVPDVSLNAVANLGYADGHFIQPAHIGDTLNAESTVLGIKENSNGKTGIVCVRTTGFNQRDEEVLKYTRWVMVKKQDANSKIQAFGSIPDGKSVITPDQISLRDQYQISSGAFDTTAMGAVPIWDDFEKDMVIDGDYPIKVGNEHQAFTRLFDNPAKVHFSGPEIVYGGFVISNARNLTHRTLGNAFSVVAINGGQHINPLKAGHTLSARAVILDKAEIEGRDDIGLLRIAYQAARDVHKDPNFKWDGSRVDPKDLVTPAQTLNFDVWAIAPKAGFTAARPR